MEQYHGHPDFYRMTEEEIQLHDQKNRDYAQGGDPLGNFKRVSAVLKAWGFDIPPALVALIYMLKQLDCAMWMLSQGYEGEVETLDKRLQDVHVYAKLARILHKETADEVVMCTRCKKRPAKEGGKRCPECLAYDRVQRLKKEEPDCDAPGYCARCSAPLIDDEEGPCSACLAS